MKSLEPKIFLRLIDANVNRSKEALRVCEDLCRFILNHRSLTQSWKRARHQLTQALLKFPASYNQLLTSRSTVSDVGRKSAIRDIQKPKVKDLLIANSKRAQESVRVLEEISKMLTPNLSPKFQKIRFALYALEKRSLSKF